MEAKRNNWEKISLGLILFISAFLRLWNIGQNGFGNSYYAATVRSMLLNWHNFFYDSYDPVGFVTVDKPPVALWLQAFSAWLFGYNGFHLILPQIIEGLVSIFLVHYLVRRRFDAWASLLAALAMGLGPICVAVDRYNNVDACLVTTLLLAAWAMSLAVEKGSWKHLLIAMALVGIGFNVKMVVAFIVLPTFYALYFFLSPLDWGKRFRDLVVATVVVAVVALSWPLFIDLTPADQRPFIGSTQDNSMIGLSLGWNGFQRLFRGRGLPGRPNHPNNVVATPGVEAASNSVNGQGRNDMAHNPAVPANSGSVSADNANGPGNNRRRGMGGMGSGEPGPFRLADKNLAGQILWFLPLALIGFIAAWRSRLKDDRREFQTQQLFLWGGWFLTYALVFSFMKGAMHTYYIVMLAPAISVLTGVGLKALWDEFCAGKIGWFLGGLFLTAVWESYIVFQFADWKAIFLPVLITGTLLTLGGLWWTFHIKAWTGSGRMTLFASCVVVLFMCPIFWCLSAVLGSGSSVEANPDLISGGTGRGMGNWGNGGANSPQAVAKLTSFLDGQSHGKYLLVAPNSQSVSPIIIATGKPVIALGGFMGGDPTMTVDDFARKVEAGQIRYFLLSGGGRNGMGRWGGTNPQNANGRANPANANNGFWGNLGRGGNGFQQEVAKWVRDHGKLVKPELWRLVRRPVREAVTQGPGGFRGGASELYDLAH